MKNLAVAGVFYVSMLDRLIKIAEGSGVFFVFVLILFCFVFCFCFESIRNLCVTVLDNKYLIGIAGVFVCRCEYMKNLAVAGVFLCQCETINKDF